MTVQIPTEWLSLLEIPNLWCSVPLFLLYFSFIYMSSHFKVNGKNLHVTWLWFLKVVLLVLKRILSAVEISGKSADSFSNYIVLNKMWFFVENSTKWVKLVLVFCMLAEHAVGLSCSHNLRKHLFKISIYFRSGEA